MVGAPRGSRLLKGLDVTNIVYDNGVDTIEVAHGNDKTSEPQPASIRRRSLRERKGDVSYDMRYHASMDPVVRPNAKRTRKNIGKSVGFASQEEMSEDEWDSESSSRSRKSGAESNSNEEDESDESGDDETAARHRYPFVLTPRTPDPRATRHSSRSAARQSVNYSTKHHPQDHSLPGYRHKAMAHPAMLVPVIPHLKAKKRKRFPPTPDSDDAQLGVNDDDSRGLEQDHEEQEDRRPRKQLRSLEHDTPSSPPPTKAATVKMAAKPFKQASVTLPDADIEIDDLVDEAIRASQLPGQISFGEDIDQLVKEAVRTTKLPTKSTRAEPIEVSSRTSSSDEEEDESEVDDERREESTSVTEGREKDGCNTQNQQSDDDPVEQQQQQQQPGDGLSPDQPEDGEEPFPDKQFNDINEDQSLPAYPNADEQLREVPDSDETVDGIDWRHRPRDNAVDDGDKEAGDEADADDEEQPHDSDFDEQFAATLGAMESESSSEALAPSDPLRWMDRSDHEKLPSTDPVEPSSSGAGVFMGHRA